MIILFYIFISIFGLCVGSFLNVVIYRLPIMISENKKKFNLALPSSHCPKCKKKLKLWHNIPLISFICLSGKCSFCKQKISARYPLIELLTGILSLLITFHFGITIKTFSALLLTYSLITLVFIDIDHFILPDEITILFLWIGLIISLFNIFTTPYYAILGATVGYISFYSIAKLFKIIKKIDGMGYGDFKLLAMLGAWFGVKSILFIIFLSSISGLLISFILIIFKKHSYNKELPFGPYIAFAGFIFMLYGNNIINLYLTHYV